MRLKDNRDLQKFLQDCQEVCLYSNTASSTPHKENQTESHSNTYVEMD